MRGTTILLAAIAVSIASWLAPSLWATNQIHDAIQFEGQRLFMPECPLTSVLWKHEVPKFDFRGTSNWKGYVAAWEIKDGNLQLVAFDALRDGKPVSIDSYLPDRKLPIRASWYTGRVRIPIGKPDWKGLDGELTYPRIVVLHIIKGKVVKTEEFQDVSLEILARERITR